MAFRRYKASLDFIAQNRSLTLRMCAVVFREIIENFKHTVQNEFRFKEKYVYVNEIKTRFMVLNFCNLNILFHDPLICDLIFK